MTMQNAVSLMLTLPALRGFWPGSAHSNLGGTVYLNDLSCSSLNLQASSSAGGVSFNFVNFSPWIYFNGSTSFYRADHTNFDITGTESYVSSDIRGITLGGWFNFLDTGTYRAMIGKYVQANQHSYLLYRPNTNRIRMLVSGDGVNNSYYNHTTSISDNVWYFCVGIYDLTTTYPTITVWVDDVKVSNSSSTYPTSIYDSTAPFEIGAYTATATTVYLYGYASWLFLCAARLDDDTVKAIWHVTRSFFGK